MLFFSLTPFYPTLAGWIPEKIRTIREPGMVKLCGGCLFDKGAPCVQWVSVVQSRPPCSSALSTYFDQDLSYYFIFHLTSAESFQERMAPFIVITLCGLSAPLLAAVATFANLEMGLVFSALFIILFLVATFCIFPRSVSLNLRNFIS